MACFKLSSCLLGNTRDTFVMHEKTKYVCFIYMQPQKVKFKFVQINMKQVSYLYGVAQFHSNIPTTINVNGLSHFNGVLIAYQCLMDCTRMH